MMHADDPQPTNTATWSRFIEKLKSFGVDIHKTKSGYCLCRTVGTMVVSYPLPKAFNPAEPDRIGVPGPFVIDSVCRNLDVSISGWYPVL